MNRLFLIVPLAVGLTACGSPPDRAGPPAPIIIPGKPTPIQPRAWPRSPHRPVEVYPYRPPASAPDAAAPGARAPRAGPVRRPAPPRVAHVPSPSASNLSSAAAALLNQAERQRQAGDYVSAAATLERALGIQPQSPAIWNRLARVRMEQGQHGQAANLARRSNALAGAHQVALKQDNWAIISAAR